MSDILAAYPPSPAGSPRRPMHLVAATRTAPQDYAALTAGYAVLAGAFALLAARSRDDPAPVATSSVSC